jgi:hypothetical protein
VFKVAESTCPKCSKAYTVFRVTEVLDLPRPGDVVVCNACGTMLQFGESMALEPIPEARWRLLPLETRSALRRMQRHVQSTN